MRGTWSWKQKSELSNPCSVNLSKLHSRLLLTTIAQAIRARAPRLLIKTTWRGLGTGCIIEQQLTHLVQDVPVNLNHKNFPLWIVNNLHRCQTGRDGCLLWTKMSKKGSEIMNGPCDTNLHIGPTTKQTMIYREKKYYNSGHLTRESCCCTYFLESICWGAFQTNQQNQSIIWIIWYFASTSSLLVVVFSFLKATQFFKCEPFY